MFKKMLLGLFALSFMIQSASAEVRTLTYTVKKHIIDNVSPDDARVIALHKAQRALNEKAASEIKDMPIIKDRSMNIDDILSIASCAFNAEIVSEKKYFEDNSFSIEIVSGIKMSSDAMENMLKPFLNDPFLLRKNQEIMKRENEILSKIEILEKENQNLKALSIEEKIKRNAMFQENVQALNAIELNREAINLLQGQKFTKPESALILISLAIRLDPDFASAYGSRGIAYSNLGMNKQALADCDKFVNLNSNSSMSYDNRGIVCLSSGQFQKAVDDFTHAIRIAGKDLIAYEGRGNAYMHLKQYDLMCPDFNKACELGYCEGLQKAKASGMCKPPEVSKPEIKEEPAAAAEPAVSKPTEENTNDIAKQMEQLVEMRKKGLISEDEYQSKTTRLLQNLK